MKPVFADSFYFFALFNHRDWAHPKAIEFSRDNDRPLVITAFVLTELADGLCRTSQREWFLRLFARLTANPKHEIVPASDELWRRGLKLYEARPDKEWSLTDCISFVVMNDRGIEEALTGDQHFVQAGFVALLQ